MKKKKKSCWGRDFDFWMQLMKTFLGKSFQNKFHNSMMQKRRVNENPETTRNENRVTRKFIPLRGGDKRWNFVIRSLWDIQWLSHRLFYFLVGRFTASPIVIPSRRGFLSSEWDWFESCRNREFFYLTLVPVRLPWIERRFDACVRLAAAKLRFYSVFFLFRFSWFSGESVRSRKNVFLASVMENSWGEFFNVIAFVI